MAMQILSMNLRSKSLNTTREVLASFVTGTDAVHPARRYSKFLREATPGSFPSSANVQTMRLPEDPVVKRNLFPYYLLRDKDVNALCDFFEKSKKVVVLTGAGIISRECEIPDYVSPDGADNTGFEPITDQKFMSSISARKRYWATSYLMWRGYREAKPGPVHTALASLEKANRISLIITQNIDGFHHRVGSNACDIHGTMHIVTCVNCGFCFPRDVFQDKLNDSNELWEREAEKPDEIVTDDDYCELHLPTCSKCNGVLKPDAVLVGGKIPDDRYYMALEAAEECESFLVLGTSLAQTFPAKLTKAAKEADATIAIVNTGETSCDDIADLKINARVEEILPRVLVKLGLAVPDMEDF